MTMDRDKIIIMINRLVEEEGGDFNSFQRFLIIRKQELATHTEARPWLPLLSFGTLILIFAELRLLSPFDNPVIAPWIVYLLIVIEIAVVALVMHRYGRKTKNSAMSSKYGMQKACVSCACELSELESALGDKIWVGPSVCPVCGCSYPAVG